MAGMQAIGAAVGVSNLQFETERAVRVAKLHKDIVNLEGNLALRLIQSAVIDPDDGRHLDVQA